MIAPEVISTGRLLLLPLREAHAEEMAAVLSDPRLYDFIGGPPPETSALRSRYARWAAGSPDPAVSWCNWVIRSRHDRCLTGTVQATITHRCDGHLAEIAWVVGAPWQGQGIAKEAARGLVDWLRRQPVGADIVAHIHPDHLASAAVASAAGLGPTDQWHEGEVTWQWRTRTDGSR